MIGFNLVPRNMRHRSRTAVNWLRVGWIFAIALTLVVASGTAFNYLTLVLYEQEVAEQRPRLLAADSLERQLRELRRENQALAQELQALPAVAGGGEPAGVLGFLHALSAAVTDGILLDWIEYSRSSRSWVVSGVGIDPGEISALFERMRRLPGVEEASLTQLRPVNGEQSRLRRFEVRVRWQAGGGSP